MTSPRGWASLCLNRSVDRRPHHPLARYRSAVTATLACSVRRKRPGVVLIKPMSWERHGLKHWIEAARKRLHRNVLAIALANKLARIAWGVLAGSRAFEASKLQAA